MMQTLPHGDYFLMGVETTANWSLRGQQHKQQNNQYIFNSPHKTGFHAYFCRVKENSYLSKWFIRLGYSRLAEVFFLQSCPFDNLW